MDSVELSQDGRKTIVVDLSPTDLFGAPEDISGVDFAACTHGGPDANTVWQPGNYDGGSRSGSFIACGPLAVPTGVELLFSGAVREVWARQSGVDDNDPEFIGVVEVR